MAERERKRVDRDRDRAEDLPVYLARPGSADPVPRQKHGGLFCNVEGAYESKTIDFDALTVGQRSRSSRATHREELKTSKHETNFIPPPSPSLEPTDTGPINTAGGGLVSDNP